LADGEPALKVSRWLGHASAVFTLDVYGQLLPERNEHEAVDALAAGHSSGNRRPKCLISW
jgi:hypothetical protein